MAAADKPIPIVIIAGPTAVGKTNISLAVARAIDGEIISADSAAVFRGLDIGTAKPTAAERTQIAHHGLDLVDPSDSFSVADFQQHAGDAIQDIVSRGKRPIVVGGTGLWIRALVRGYELSPQAGPSGLRIRIHDAAVQDEFRSLRRQLQVVDPASYAAIAANDHRRLVRALEVWITTGHPLRRGQNSESRYAPIYWVLSRSVAELHQRIESRTRAILRAGLAEEASRLIAAGVPPRAQSMSAIGYRETVDWLYGRLTQTERDHLIVRHTQQLAKRQLTWFRSETDARWLDLSAWPLDDAVAKIVQSAR